MAVITHLLNCTLCVSLAQGGGGVCLNQGRREPEWANVVIIWVFNDTVIKTHNNTVYLHRWKFYSPFSPWSQLVIQNS